MTVAIVKLITILQMTISGYHYENPSDFIEMFGHASNEYSCKQLVQEDRVNHAVCASYCAASMNWFSDDDIELEIGEVCSILKITNRDIHGIE